MTDKDKKKKPAKKPISLKPLKFEEAVEGLLRVKPTEKEAGRRQGRHNRKVAGTIKRFGPTEARSLNVSAVGNYLRQSLTAAESVLGVVREINLASGRFDDPDLKRQFDLWADTLTDAVIMVSSSSDSTTTDITSLYLPGDDKREK